jgi:hypothetical protein
VWEAIKKRARELKRVVAQMFYGMTTFDWVRGLRRERAEVESLFMLIIFGDMIGLPILPPYYSVRLLPYVIPVLNRWKRSLLRERDWTDLISLIEGAE